MCPSLGKKLCEVAIAVWPSGNFIELPEDVTVNGLINSSDIAFVQSKSGTALP
jgi:hypothetical protein